MPITAATILFLCRVREASAKKSVLLWDVMVKVERATEVTTGGERSDTERVKPGQRGERRGGEVEREERRRGGERGEVEREERRGERGGEPAALSAVPLSLGFTQLTERRSVVAAVDAADLRAGRSFQRFLFVCNQPELLT